MRRSLIGGIIVETMNFSLFRFSRLPPFAMTAPREPKATAPAAVIAGAIAEAAGADARERPVRLPPDWLRARTERVIKQKKKALPFMRQRFLIGLMGIQLAFTGQLFDPAIAVDADEGRNAFEELIGVQANNHHDRGELPYESSQQGNGQSNAPNAD